MCPESLQTSAAPGLDIISYQGQPWFDPEAGARVLTGEEGRGTRNLIPFCLISIRVRVSFLGVV